MKRFGCLLILLFAAFGASPTLSETLNLNHCQESVLPLQPWLRVWQNAPPTADFSEARALPVSAWQPAESLHLSPGMQPNVVLWLQFRIHNASAQACEQYLFLQTGRLRDIQLFVEQEGRVERKQAGMRYPYADWDVPLRLPVFALNFPAGSTTVFWLRAESRLNAMLQPALWSETAFVQTRLAEDTLDGLVFGAVLLLVVFSWVIAFVLRLPLLFCMAWAVLAYLGYLAAVNSYTFYYLWPQEPELNRQVAHLGAALALLLSSVCLGMLIKLRQAGPFFWYAYLVLLVLSPLSVWAGSAVFPVAFLSLLFRVLLLAAVFVNWRRNGAASWLYLLLVAYMLLEWLLQNFMPSMEMPSVFQDQTRYLSLTVLPGGILLLTLLLGEVWFGRRREQQARQALRQWQFSEQERLEQAVDERTEQLQQSLQARAGMLARISHDLRSPLASIIEYAHRLQVGSDRDDYPVIIERHARQQLELIDELLEFSRGELDQLEILEAPNYLYSFLARVTDDARLLAERQNNRLVCHIEPRMPPVLRADYPRLRQVLMNLLGNAAKFTHDGGIRFSVSRLPLENPRHLRLAFVVEDSGIGIDPAELGALQKPFGRGRNARRHEGSGLGLFIVSQLLERMGSRLQAESLPSGGSRFSFELELEIAREADMDQALFSTHRHSPVLGLGRRILVIDDMEENRDLLVDLLAGNDFDPLTARDGEEALRLLETEAIDLVLTDQVMPRMDAWALLAAIRQRWPQLPVLLYSASPPIPPEGWNPDWRFSSALLKPTDGAELLYRIDHLLGR